jgi:uncharacterized protein (DUF488 family)
MPSLDLFSIGHSNIAADRFVGMLAAAGVGAVADVRSIPFSRRFPWFSAKNLAERLSAAGIDYEAFGQALGGRPDDAKLYCDGVADYEAMARLPAFRAGLDRVQAMAGRGRVCLMCAEREPLDCHRCLLVARAFAERGLTIGHILHDGTVEAHGATEQRLLELTGAGADDLFVTGQDARLAAAYRRRAKSVAYRVKNPQRA